MIQRDQRGLVGLHVSAPLNGFHEIFVEKRGVGTQEAIQSIGGGSLGYLRISERGSDGGNIDGTPSREREWEPVLSGGVMSGNERHKIARQIRSRRRMSLYIR